MLCVVMAVIGSHYGHHAQAAGPRDQAGVTTVTAQTDVDASIDALIAVAPASQPPSDTGPLAGASGTAAIGVSSNSSYGVGVYDVLMPQGGVGYGLVRVLLGYVTL
jgi:hypothetical protein